MNARDKIIAYLKENSHATGSDLSGFLGISRQALNKHLKKLIEGGKVVKEGATRGAVYRLALPGEETGFEKKYKKKLSLKGLEEDKIFHEMAALLNLKKALSKDAWDITYYSFTEMLNNAIDHSMAEYCTVESFLDQYHFTFRIRDCGIGIFHSIFSKFNLPDEISAIGELLKGKTTTMKERHSGEGIFFTSKCADSIHFKSHKVELLFDNIKDDVYVKEKKSMEGTEVFFSIGRRSKKSLEKVFSLFAPEEFGFSFEKTRVLVKLYHRDYISRSEAKRLLHGLDRFREIVLDFRGVNSIGQGFTDEIFRVFKEAHPETSIITENVAPTIEIMIRHVVDNST